MSRILSRFGLPLLSKELIEQSARKRTYVIRVLYATLLFCGAYVIFYDSLSLSLASPAAALGLGRKIFVTVVGLQFAGTYLFMPALTCSAITHEKERSSLALLFLTRLGPWTIVFEKLLSRLVPMFGFVLLSLPLLAYAYTLGGVSREQIWMGVWLLLLAGLELGAIALCCSAFFRTTIAAFLASYLIAALVSLGPGLLIISLVLVGRAKGSTSFEQLLMGTGLFEDEIQFLFPFFPAFQFLAGTNPGAATRVTVPAWLAVPARSLPTLLMAAAALALARIFLVRRAFIAPRNLLLNLFRALDRWFVRLNENRLTRGRILLQDGGDLPGDEPVAWRETTRRSLGKGRYLLRVLLAFELPVAALVGLIGVTNVALRSSRLSMLCQATWVCAALIVSLQSANLIGGERSRQTLDVLCAMPLAGREIIRQKYRAVRRLLWALWAPFLTIFFYGCIWVELRSRHTGFEIGGREAPIGPDALFCLARSILSVAVNLPAVAWLSLWIGLKLRSRTRAVLTAPLVMFAGCLIPILLSDLAFENAQGLLWNGGEPTWQFKAVMAVRSLSPLSTFHFDELQMSELVVWRRLLEALNFIGCGVCLAVFRWLCLSRADRLLGRLEGAAASTPAEPPSTAGTLRLPSIRTRRPGQRLA